MRLACLDRREFSFECQNVVLRHVLQTNEASSCLGYGPKQLIKLQVDRLRVAVLRRLVTKTMRKVTIVVPVLITSCHVSEKRNIGPVIAHSRTSTQAAKKAHDVPTALAVSWANLRKCSRMAVLSAQLN